MTYEDIIYKVRMAYEYADARAVFEHIAVQVNITGQVTGAFYVEVANREICVEPYDYYDRDGLITVDAATVVAIADGNITLREAYNQGYLQVEGDIRKLRLLEKIVRKYP